MTFHQQSYDFIIVGGGTAGLVVATRLSENPDHSILVLEAGADLSRDPRVKTPAFYTQLLGSEADWAFETVPQDGINSRVLVIDQGRTLGGSSSINASVLVPPSKSLINSWEFLGNENWGWSDMKPYFDKAFATPIIENQLKENLGIDEWIDNSPNSQGLILTSFQGNLNHPIRKAWASAFKARDQYMAGTPYWDATIGSFSCLVSTDPIRGERSNATSAYYNPVRLRPNLCVLTGALVTKILFEENCGKQKAIAVQYVINGERLVVSAEKEVILAGGALQSPKLLELSGIGQSQLLKQHGIPILKDLPGVGENLQDHVVSGISFEVHDHISSSDALMRGEQEAIQEAIELYQNDQAGPLTSIGLSVYAYLPVMKYMNGSGHDHLQQVLRNNRPKEASSIDNVRDRLFYGVAEALLLDPGQPSAAFFAVTAQAPLPVEKGSGSPEGLVPGKWLTIGAMLSAPLSRGNVHISSDDINDPPIVDPRYLSNKVDEEVFAEHLCHIESIASSPEMQSVLKQPLIRRDPNSYIHDLRSAKEFMRRSSISNWHVVGTCSMLPEAKGGVVGSDLKIHGTTNLRVVDSSAIPLISAANIQATVYAFAERAADLIKASYK